MLVSIASLSSARYISNDCPSDFTIHLLLPHETDCNKFYQCSNGQKIQMTCPTGLYFDFNLQTCNHPASVICVIKPRPEIEVTTTESTVTVTAEESSTTLEFLPNGCPADIHVHYLLPHEYDCTKFYQCDFGQLHLKLCPAGLFFDFSIQICNWPQYVNCEKQTTIEVTQPSETAETTSTSSTTSKGDYTVITTPTLSTTLTTDIDVTNNTSIYVSTTPDDLETSTNIYTTLQTESSTEQFLSTDPDIPTVVTTPIYPTTNEPDSITFTTAATESESLTNISQSDQSTTATENGSHITDPITTTESLYTHSTTESNMIDVSTIVTEIATDHTAEESTPKYTLPTSVKDSEMTTSDMFFSSTSTITTVSTSSSAFPETTSTERPFTMESTTEVYLTTTETKEEATTQIPICPPGVTGNVPHPDLCDSYYFCSGGMPIQLQCPMGHEFDPETKRCGAIEEGQCSLGSSTQSLTTDNTFATDSTATSTETYPLTTAVTKDDNTEFISTTNLIEITTEKATTITAESTTESLDSTKIATDGLSTTEMEVLTTISTDSIITQTQSVTIQTSTSEYSSPTDLTNSDTTGLSSITESLITEHSSTMETTQASTTQQDLTTQAPLCPSGTIGNVPHPELCDSYYFCSGGVPILLHCNAGQEFDPDARRCAPISQGGCTLGSTTQALTEESTFVTNTVAITTEINPFSTAVTNDVDTEYISTTSFIEITTENATTITAESTVEISTSEFITASDPANSNTTELSSTTEFLTTDLLAKTETTQISTPQEATTQAPLCPSGTIGNVPHPELCDSYYFCSGGVPILLRCPAGQEFDPDVRRCVPTSQGGCTLESTTQALTTESIFLTDTVATSTGTNLFSTAVAEDIYTEYISTTKVIEITTDKATTITAESTTENLTSTQTATDGISTTETEVITTQSTDSTISQTQFETIQTINPEFTTHTDLTDSYTTGLSFTTESLTTEYSKTTQTSTAQQDVTTQAPVCPSGTVGNVPHPELCDSYYFCTGGVPILLRCPAGQEFDRDIKRCVEITEVGCTLSSTTHSFATESLVETDMNPNIPDQTSTEDEEATVINDPYSTESMTAEVSTLSQVDTTKYYTESVSMNDYATTSTDDSVEEIIGSNTADSTTERSSNILESSSTIQLYTTEPLPIELQEITTLAPICLPGILGNVAHQELCSSYYFCSGGVPILLNCPAGQEFDPEARRCVTIHAEGCTLGSSSRTYKFKIERMRRSTDNEIKSDSATNSVENIKAICPKGFSGHLPHPESCETFYLCTDKSFVQMFCPMGYEFNKNTSKCELKNTSGC